MRTPEEAKGKESGAVREGAGNSGTEEEGGGTSGVAGNPGGTPGAGREEGGGRERKAERKREEPEAKSHVTSTDKCR